MNSNLIDDLRMAGYTEVQVAAVGEFLEEFCEESHVYVVNIFLRCRRVNFQKILRECQHAFQTFWHFGSPGRIGDVDDVTPMGTPDSKHPVRSFGMNNMKGFVSVYEILGMGCPKML